MNLTGLPASWIDMDKKEKCAAEPGKDHNENWKALYFNFFHFIRVYSYHQLCQPRNERDVGAAKELLKQDVVIIDRGKPSRILITYYKPSVPSPSKNQSSISFKFQATTPNPNTALHLKPQLPKCE